MPLCAHNSLDRVPVSGQLSLSSQTDLMSEAATSSQQSEISTEPTEEELAADRERDLIRDHELQEEAVSPVLWPSNDRDSPEYAHLTDMAVSSSFDVTPEEVERLIAANRFRPEGQSNVIGLAIRGSALKRPHEQERQ